MVSASAADDRELLARLSRAVAEGRVRLDLDPALLTHVHSPMASQAEANLPIYAGLAVAAAIAWFWRWEAGVVIAIGLLVWLATLGRRLFMRRVRRRIERETLDDLAAWRQLWRFGGVTLVRDDRMSSAMAPADSWQQFALGLPAVPAAAGGPAFTPPAGPDPATAHADAGASAPPPPARTGDGR